MAVSKTKCGNVITYTGTANEVAQALSDGDYNKDYERYVVAQGRDLHTKKELGEDHDLFWEHLEKMMSKKFDETHRNGMGWSCTC